MPNSFFYNQMNILRNFHPQKTAEIYSPINRITAGEGDVFLLIIKQETMGMSL